MSTSTNATVAIPAGIESRLLNEAYGPGAWHGADLKAALADVTAALAFWRPGPGRHNVAEIALHHAYCARAVRSQLTGRSAEAFVLAGDDWFEADDDRRLSWEEIRTTVDTEQHRLAAAVADIETGGLVSPVSEPERFQLVLGIVCHAIYHAGQVQLIKRLRGDRG